jgi:membrane peptidoglycan carboxypeptidase
MVIGAIAVHPIEMAAAYAAVADNGVYHAPSFIDHIVDRYGNTIYTGNSPGKRVVSAQVAEEATIALQAVVQYGTGVAAQLYGRPVAGKTGTTTNSVDAWFNGFTPQMETTVWMGNPNGEVPVIINGIEVYGANYPAETWHDFMSYALADLPILQFPPPDYALMSAPKFITSPGLVADDVLDHNYAAPPPTVPSPTATTVTPSTLPTTGTTTATTTTTGTGGPPTSGPGPPTTGHHHHGNGNP